MKEWRKTLGELASVLPVGDGEAVPGATIIGDGNVLVSGVTYDSRLVEPGYLFIAVRGERYDGHSFLPAVIEAGASAVVIQTERASEFAELSVPRLAVPDCRRAMAPLALAFYENPTRQLYLAGVTGTNGKTTTTLMIDSIARAAGDITGTIGTLGATVAGHAIPHDRTTPEAPDLQRLFAEMRDAGATSAAMEVASHALALGRVEGCAYDVGIFTNLTQDHLDFHGTMEAYRDAKGLLFTEYAEVAKAAGKSFTAVLNISDEAGKFYAAQTRADRVLTYALTEAADIWPENVVLAVDRITYTAKTPVGEVPVELKFGGTFNVANSLAAVGYGVARGLSPEIIATGLANCPPVPGRFQPVRTANSTGNRLTGEMASSAISSTGQDYAVLVDYAHTPDGLENVLNSARPLTTGRLIVVFGCGGNRDRTKRPLMGGIAARLADVVVVTSDNPRKENPEAIIDDIFTGISSGSNVHRESDRRAAIALAVGMAEAGDTVVIAGKGHEEYQILGDTTIPFSDVEVAMEQISDQMLREEIEGREK